MRCRTRGVAHIVGDQQRTAAIEGHTHWAAIGLVALHEAGDHVDGQPQSGWDAAAGALDPVFGALVKALRDCFNGLLHKGLCDSRRASDEHLRRRASLASPIAVA